VNPPHVLGRFQTSDEFLEVSVRIGRQGVLLLKSEGKVVSLIGCSVGAGPVSPEWMVPKALWLRRHERTLFDRAA
jgi:hypothetical protein